MSQNKPSFITRLLTTLSKFQQFVSNIIDKLLYSKQYLAFVSLGIALLIFASVFYTDALSNQIKQSLELTVPVEVVGNLDEYELTGVPESVDSIVTGSAIDVRNAQNSESFRGVIDVTGLTEGNHRIKFERKGFPQSLNVIFTPETIDINLSRKISQEFGITTGFINEARLGQQYILSEPKLEINSVVINTSQEKMNQISEVRALIDVSDKTENFTAMAKVVAYDQNGQAMNLDIEPEEVRVSVEVTSPSRTVPVVVYPVGTIPKDKVISSITINYPEITLFGPQSVLNDITEIPLSLNAENLSESPTVINHTLSRPEGVRALDIETVEVTVNLADKSSQTIEKSQVFFENNINNYQVTKSDQSNLVVDVVVSGAQERIDALNEGQIKVFIDMTDITIGKQTVTLQVSGPDHLLTYEVTNPEVNINVAERGE